MLFRFLYIIGFIGFISLSSGAVAQQEVLNHFTDCPGCPEMVVLPKGSFLMGREVAGRAEEGPPQQRVIDAPFAIARTETTFDQYEVCVSEGGCAALPFDRRWGKGARPVIYVDWQAAMDYAAWLSQKTGRSYRLPTEAEWEYAARANRPAPRNKKGRVNCFECWDGWAHKTEPTASFPPNGFGLYDMLGNVTEWTADCWRPRHDASEVRGEAGTCETRTRKGGSWYFKDSVATPTYRFGARSAHKGYDIGFRVVADLK